MAAQQKKVEEGGGGDPVHRGVGGGLPSEGHIHSSYSTFQTLLENFGIKTCTHLRFFWFKQISTALLLHL